jgi:hypothetical protein
VKDFLVFFYLKREDLTGSSLVHKYLNKMVWLPSKNNGLLVRSISNKESVFFTIGDNVNKTCFIRQTIRRN